MLCVCFYFSFGTDSPLDLDVKDRLMAQVLPTLAALPDDEVAYIRYQKNEAAKRLIRRRTTAEIKSTAAAGLMGHGRSQSKPPTTANNRRSTELNSSSTSPPPRRTAAAGASGNNSLMSPLSPSSEHNRPEENSEPVVTEGGGETLVGEEGRPQSVEEAEAEESEERELETHDENEIALRSHLDEDGALKVENMELNTIIEDIHQQAVLQADQEAADATVDGVTPSEDKQSLTMEESLQQSSVSRAPVTPERLEVIKKELREIYEICSPEKISKIDRLLHKYSGREEEFLEFVHIKYCVPSVENVSLQSQAVDVANEKDGSKTEVIDRDAEQKKAAAAVIPKRPRPVVAQAKPLVRPPFRGGGGVSRRFTAFDDNIGSGNGRRGAENDAGRDQLRQEILAEHVSTDDTDPWMVREGKFLKEFIRIFPPKPKTHNKSSSNDTESNTNGLKNSARSGGAEGEEEDDDDDNSDEEDGDSEAMAIGGKKVNSNDGSDDKAQQKKKKKPSASYEDILFSVFELDRRLLMRFQRPPRERSESADAASKSSSTSNGLATNASKDSLLKESKDTETVPAVKPVVVSRAQAEAAARLSQGLSTLKLSEESKNQHLHHRNVSPDKNVYIDNFTFGSGKNWHSRLQIVACIYLFISPNVLNSESRSSSVRTTARVLSWH